jgi:DNA primase
MAYGIPAETVEYVRSQADIVQVVSEYMTLKKAGANYKACCPFHKEKTPSFVVSPSKQLYHCFGCGAGGNIFGFLMRHEGFSFAEAVRYLAERLGIQIKEVQQAPGQRELREQLLDLYQFATTFFHRSLLRSAQSDHARNYLKERDISEEAIKVFSLGHAPAGWDSLVQEAPKKGFSKELLLQGGLAKKSPEGRVYDTFRNRIMFPIWGISGKVIAFGGRTLEEDQPKYINSPETPIYTKGQTLYNLHRAKKSISDKSSVVVVEGYTDLIRLALNGIENAVASLGTAFTQAQARLIKRYASEVVLVFDSDSAGVAAAGRGIEVLLAEDLGVKVAVIPSGKDPDEFVLERGAQAFHDIVNEARNFVEFHIENAMASRNGLELENKIKAANALASLVGKMPDPIKRNEYLRLVAGRLDIDPETLLAASQRSSSSDKIEEEVRHAERMLGHEEKKCMWLVKLLLQRPEYVGKVRESFDAEMIQNEALRELFDRIFELEESELDEHSLFDRIQNEKAQQILSQLMFEEAGPEMLYPIEWWTAFIKSRQKEKEMTLLSKEIAKAETAGNAELLERLLKQKSLVKRDLENIRKERMNISVETAAGSLLGG